MATCPRCGRPIQPGQPTDDDHVVARSLGGMATQPAHRACNRSHGAHLGNAIRHNTRISQAHDLLTHPEPGRLIVLLTGPPGAGKTTLARQAGLPVLDRDDPQWRRPNAEQAFRRALTQLGNTPQARAVIIRAAPTTRARADTITAAHATHAYMLTIPPDLSHDRVTTRARADAHTSHRAIANWWHRHTTDPTPRQLLTGPFPGWDTLLDTLDQPATPWPG